MSDSEVESKSSFSSIDEGVEEIDDMNDVNHVSEVRNSVREWKLREMDGNTNESSKAKGLQGLRNYVAKSATLFYDLINYMKTAQNKEQNMKDTLYVSIVNSIGAPGTLNYHVRTILEHILQRDLIELPFTVEPKVINSYAKKGLEVQTEFPDEE
jgi:hypothetical protein